MHSIDLTNDFRLYRDATRLIWNTFLHDNPDRELDFLEIDLPLFHAILQSKLDVDLEQTNNGTPYYPTLMVKAFGRTALQLQEAPDVNHWTDTQLPKYLELNYSGLFDFECDEAAYRDFQYIKCVANRQISEAAFREEVWLVEARTARIYFLKN